MSEASLFGQERWTATELASVLGLSTQRVNQLVKEGILPPAVDGRYSPKVAVSGYIKHLEMKQEMSSRAGEEVRKLEMENQMRLIKLQKIASALVPIDRLERDWAEFTGRVRDGLLSLPGQLSGQFAEESNQEKIFDLFSSKIHETLTRLSSRPPAVKSESGLPGAVGIGDAPSHDVPDDGGLERLLDDSQPPGEGHGPAESKEATFDEAFLDQGTDEDSEHRFADGD